MYEKKTKGNFKDAVKGFSKGFVSATRGAYFGIGEEIVSKEKTSPAKFPNKQYENGAIAGTVVSTLVNMPAYVTGVPFATNALSAHRSYMKSVKEKRKEASNKLEESLQ